MKTAHKNRRIFAFLLAAALAIPLWGIPAPHTVKAAGYATYYVSPTGDDANDGLSAAAPFGTLQHAADRLTPGDTLYLMDGTYRNQSIYLNGFNKSATPVYTHILAYPGAKPVITGQVVYAAFKVDQSNYVVFDGITVENTSPAPGKNGYAGAFDYWGVSYIIVRNCVFRNIGTSIVCNGAYMGESSYCVVKDCLFDTCSDRTLTQSTDWIAVQYHSNHILFDGLDMRGGPHTNIGMNGAYNCVIRNCDFHNDWQKNLGIGAENTPVDAYNVVENNILRDGKHAIAAGYEQKGGIGMQLGSNKNIVRNNYFVNNEFYGMIIDAYGSDFGGFMAPASANNKIYNNTFADNGYSAQTGNPGGTVNCGVFVTTWGYPEGTPYYNLSGNTFKNNLFYNNGILAGGSGFTSEMIFNVDFAKTPEFLQNNLFYNSASADVIRFQNNSNNTIAGAQTQYPGIFAKNITDDPMVAPAATETYTLQDDSPAIDAGSSLTTATNAGLNATALTVQDAGYFSDGFGVPVDETSVAAGDTIMIGGAPAQITAVDYATNTITLAAPCTWFKGVGVALAYKGTMPDIGAWESDQSVQRTDPTAYTNVALGKPVINDATGGWMDRTACATDGDTVYDESANDWTTNVASAWWPSTRTSSAYIVIDLGADYYIDTLKVWHGKPGNTYPGAVWQLSEDSAFTTGVVTVFNDDGANMAGQGVGTDAVYAETAGGKTVKFTPVTARYIRCFEAPNARNSADWLEVEAWGSSGPIAPATSADLVLDSTNLAAGKTVAATSASASAGNITDGQTGTQWVSGGAGDESFVVNLGAACKVNSVVLDWGADYAVKYSLQTSTDGVNYTEVLLYTINGGGYNKLTFDPVSCQYVKVELLAPSGADYSVAEIGVYGDGQGQVVVPEDPNARVNVALNKPIIGYLGTISDPTWATDGSLNYNWYETSPGSGVWKTGATNLFVGNTPNKAGYITIDLGKSYYLDELDVLYNPAWDAHPSAIVWQLSNDGAFSAGVTTVYNSDAANLAGQGAGTDPAYTGDMKTVSFSPTSARYIRVWGVSTNYEIFYTEVEAYGTLAAQPEPYLNPDWSNLAKWRVAAADSGVNPYAVIDGDTSTGWASAAAGEHALSVDLGKTYNVDDLIVDWSAYYATKYKVQLSADNTTWTEAAYVSVNNGGLSEVTFAQTPARYVKLVMLESSGSAYGINELGVYGAGEWASNEYPDGSVNVALGKPVTPTSYNDTAAVTNGDYSNPYYNTHAWSNSANVTVDFGASCDVYKIVEWHYYPDGRTYASLIMKLSDTADFSADTTVYDTTKGDPLYTETPDGLTVAFDPVSARYYRSYLGMAPSGGNHWVEIQVWAAAKSIAVDAANSVTRYNIGDSLDMTILSTNIYDTVTSVAVTPDMATGFDSTKPGVQTIQIFYQGRTISCQVTVGSPDKAALAALIAQADEMIAGGAFAASTPESVTALQNALAAAKAVNDDVLASQDAADSALAALRAALDNARASQGTFDCTVKSMLAKVAKSQKIPYVWTGAGALAFTSSNAAVCGVTPDGTLVPLKAGIAVITIAIPGGAKYVFAVTVTV